MHNILKKAKLGVPQTASDDQVSPPKPITIKVQKVKKMGDDD